MQNELVSVHVIGIPFASIPKNWLKFILKEYFSQFYASLFYKTLLKPFLRYPVKTKMNKRKQCFSRIDFNPLWYWKPMFFRFCLTSPKTFPENWDSKAPSVGTLFANLETTAKIILFLGIKLFCFLR